MGWDENNVVERAVNTIRFLAVDAIQKAKSGHPGLPMGAAAMGYTLWTRHLAHNPSNPLWCNRDRFVLSAGHGSMLLYALLHLTGYDLSLDDIRNFRRLSSRTPGHPEWGHTPGVEVTTGPLGQGIAAAVGMAIAEAYLAARYNRPGYNVVDHFTYVIAGDGDLMEGVCAEACALAGHLRLGKLVVLFDDNRISLAGSVSLSSTEDICRRFEASKWHVLRVKDGNDVDAVDAALARAKAEISRPSLICVETVIGYGSPCKEGSCSCHGSPLGPDEVRAAKERLGWPREGDFFVPDDVRVHMRETVAWGQELEEEYRKKFEEYRASHPGSAAELERMLNGTLPDAWDDALDLFPSDKPLSTRKASETVLQVLGARMPELIGGTADLNPSTLAWLKECGDFQSPECSCEGVEGAVGGPWDYSGRNIHFGVREHAMGAIANGIALHGGLIPFVGTFFVFSDYMRPPMRLAALMGIRVVYVFSHDSIGVGEDGPTHQPVEHLMSLRVVPNLTVIRPSDAAETAEAWKYALAYREGPTALVLTRQDVPVVDRTRCAPASGLHKGAYILWESGEGVPDAVIVATGSEVHLALKAAETLAGEGLHVRVVAMPAESVFDRQSEEYRAHVLPPRVKARVAVEAGITRGWERYVGLQGAVVGMTGFGASAPGPELYEKFGITAAHVAAAVRDCIRRTTGGG